MSNSNLSSSEAVSLAFILGLPQANCKAISTSMSTHCLRPSSVFGSRRVDEPSVVATLSWNATSMNFRVMSSRICIGFEGGQRRQLVIRDGIPTAPKDEQRPQPRTPDFWATQDLLREEMNLQDCNIPSRRTQETSWAIISRYRLDTVCAVCSVAGSREVLRRYSSPDCFRNLCVTWRGKSACNCCE